MTITMRLLRRIGLFVTGTIFRSMLLLTVACTAFVVIAGNGKYAKEALTATKAYDRFVPAVLEANSTQAQSSQSIPIDDPIIQTIVNAAFPPEVLQSNAEMVVDSMYSWLRGKTVEPSFRVDLTENKQKLATDLGNYAVLRLSEQPVCTVLPAQINPFTANCQPAGFNAAAQAKPLITQISESPGLLPQTVFTANDLPKVKSGRVITERYSYAPRIFRWLMWSPWISGILLTASGVLLVLLNRTKRIGLYRAGFEIVSNGVLFMASPIIFGYVVPAISKNLDLPDSSGAGVQVILNDIIRYYSGFFDNFFINAGIYFALTGVLLIAAAKALQMYTGYHTVEEKAGLVTSNAPRPRKQGKVILTYASVPLQSSERHVVAVTPKRISNKKYRTIPKKEM
jgi:hypothetical protein